MHTSLNGGGFNPPPLWLRQWPHSSIRLKRHRDRGAAEAATALVKHENGSLTRICRTVFTGTVFTRTVITVSHGEVVRLMGSRSEQSSALEHGTVGHSPGQKQNLRSRTLLVEGNRIPDTFVFRGL